MTNDRINYLVRDDFDLYCGFTCKSEHIHRAVLASNEKLAKLPLSLYQSIDYKTTSSIVGSLFQEALANETGAIVNPIEKGHPDLIPESGRNATEKDLRNYPQGIEIKTTIGNVVKNSNLKTGDSRIKSLNGITWQAHHREVRSLLGLVWDFYGIALGSLPIVTGSFYSKGLDIDDWGAISGTTGRNTKVTGMKVSGLSKMGAGWIVLLNDKEYLWKYHRLLNFSLPG